MKRSIREIRYFIEYSALRALVVLIRVLPYSCSIALGEGVAWLAFHVARFRVKPAVSRIRDVFGQRYSELEARGLAWRAWRNFVLGIVDLIVAPSRSSEDLTGAVEHGGELEKILKHLREAKVGAIIAIPHMGAWELAAFAAAANGIPLFTMAARQKNRLADEYMNRLRQASGVETVMRDSSVLKSVIKKIRSGMAFAILPDLRAPQPGLTIRFLDKDANIAGGMGFLAKQTGAPVFPVVMTRVDNCRHRCRIFDPIWPDSELDKDADASRITQVVFDIFSNCVSAEPEQWFWFNKRWIFDPFKTDEVEEGGQAVDARFVES